MLHLRDEEGGARFEVRVMPRSQPAGLAGVRDGRLVVRVGAPAVDGRANAALVEVLAERLQLAKRDVAIVAGERARTKQIVVRGLSAAAVAALLED